MEKHGGRTGTHQNFRTRRNDEDARVGIGHAAIYHDDCLEKRPRDLGRVLCQLKHILGLRLGQSGQHVMVRLEADLAYKPMTPGLWDFRPVASQAPSVSKE